MEPKGNQFGLKKGDWKSNLRCEKKGPREESNCSEVFKKHWKTKKKHCAELQQLLQKTYVIIHNAFWHMRLIWSVAKRGTQAVPWGSCPGSLKRVPFEQSSINSSFLLETNWWLMTMGLPFWENMGEEKHTLSARHCFCLDNSRAGHGGWKQLRYWFSFFPRFLIMPQNCLQWTHRILKQMKKQG